ncbi:GL23534 [Drosophila persimilis]|uniref:GL23534 n=1 Tax=Drosophila persimilis TaxID=7234 RepID=B4G2W5_DROPE|nr:GL23534 [Drosophila persimilis]
MHEKPQCYFLIVENLEDEDLDEVFDYWKGMLNWNPLAQFVVYLAAVEETDEEMTDLMVELLLTFMNKKIFNVNVIGQSEENEFYYGKSVFPYHPDNNCGNRVIAVELLDACDYPSDHRGDNDGDGDYEEEDDKVQSGHGVQSSKEDQFDRSSEGPKADESGNEDPPAKSTESNNEDPSGQSTDSKNQSEDQSEHSTESDERHRSPNVTPKIEATIEEFFRAKFEDKFPRDLSGCPLTAAFRPWEPYIFRSGEEPVEDYYYGTQGDGDYNETTSYGDSGDESYADVEAADTTGILEADGGADGSKSQLSGIEYQMVQTIAERLNVHIDMQAENSNLYHLFQQLIDGEIEMIVGGIDEDPSISQFVSSSIPYHQDDLTWCVARAKRKHGFFNFVANFNADTGFLLLLFIVTCSFMVLMAQRVTGFRLRNLNNYFAICLRMLGILLTQAMPAQTLSLVLRQLFALSFLMGFFFSNTYQSFLISTLTTPRSSHQIQSLEEIYSHRMTIMGSSENVRHLNKDGEIFKYIREKFQMCYNIVDCLNDAANNEHIAVAVSRLHSFYNPRIQRDRLFCFDRRESLYVYLVTMLLPKKYHLLHQINPVIQHIIESGHMQKWARDLDRRRMIHEEINRVREDPFKALTLAQFHGAFAFSSGLLLISFSVFLIEWALVKCYYRARG